MAFAWVIAFVSVFQLELGFAVVFALAKGLPVVVFALAEGLAVVVFALAEGLVVVVFTLAEGLAVVVFALEKGGICLNLRINRSFCSEHACVQSELAGEQLRCKPCALSAGLRSGGRGQWLACVTKLLRVVQGRIQK